MEAIWAGDSPLLPMTRRRDGYDVLFAPMEVVGCVVCGHVFNHGFVPSTTDSMYGDVALTNIPADPSMHQRLTSLFEWLPQAAVQGHHVLEIGAGGGHLARLLARAARQVTVIEPCLGLTRDLVPEANIHLIHDLFPSSAEIPPAGLCLARQVLEHTSDPRAFFRALVATMTPDGYAYVEIPNAEYIRNHGAILDIHVQHIQYFTPQGLVQLAGNAGLVAERMIHIKDGHDIGILFRKGTVPAQPLHSGGEYDFQEWRRALQCRIDDLAAVDFVALGRIALYGVTMHGQVLLNLPGFDASTVVAAFDDNHANLDYGLYTPTGFIPAQAPTALTLAEIDTVIITAYLHDQVMEQKLRTLGFSGTVLTAGTAGHPRMMGRLFSVIGERAC
ncbi:MAG: class I SAM-dependent methyltransferase [Phaeospirillum sp.]|nr:class I SAM-dependent methyltransferase [Phaeospirillum sp.]